jgi:hypothetical protein
VVPQYAERSAGATAAGAASAALLVTTVVVELASPALLARIGHRCSSRCPPVPGSRSVRATLLVSGLVLSAAGMAALSLTHWNLVVIGGAAVFGAGTKPGAAADMERGVARVVIEPAGHPLCS